MEEEITSILVDDEINARENLRFLLANFCKNVNVLAEATNVDEALEQIRKYRPQVVFLDIEMPQKNGFQLFESFDQIDFQVIFITAHDSYAIKAFQVAAIDYLLKPVEIQLLQNAVKKAQNYLQQDTIDNRVQLLNENKKKINKIAVPYKSDYAIISVQDILYIQADRMYSIIYTNQQKKYTVAKKLHYYEELLQEEGTFIRVHRSWIVNSDKIKYYSRKERSVQLLDDTDIPVSKGYKLAFEAIFES
ncbi:LytR/AlgR family response regulator transcription factor [Aquimarina rubra]|uniref:LytR/AlgR family response regulator transcription factor n=1 Tax=Aquimarina rubra TaxID=1920033 RepID=A0ABW5LC36_9FLAO